MSREIKFRIWNMTGNCMHEWRELVEKNKIHLLANQQPAYPVMQFTGLKDKNGIEIYEGDIVECWTYHLQIVWDKEDASFFAANYDSRIYESGQEWSGNCEVIGNIYQNPELLK